MNNWRIRLAGVILSGTALWYGPWMFLHVNRGALWLAIPFLAANTLVLVNILVTCVNNWQRTVPPARLVPLGEEPDVIVIIPTAGEPVKMVHRTVVSVVTQNWPQERLRIIVSDDAHSLAVKLMVDMLRRNHPDPLFLYHRPPKRGSANRRGDAKAGNLNSALEVARRFWPDVAFVETRDADDEVGDPNFLRHCVGQMQANANVAFVQTIKEARVSAGDPFANMETFFYRGTMLGRNAANAVFPCGSGLLWRTEALLDITGFPTWNLVVHPPSL